jgi:hypothetical protein
MPRRRRVRDDSSDEDEEVREINDSDDKSEREAVARENAAEYSTFLDTDHEPATVEKTRSMLRVIEKVGAQNYYCRKSSQHAGWKAALDNRFSIVDAVRQQAFSARWTAEARRLFDKAHSLKKIMTQSDEEIEAVRDGSGQCMLCGTKCAGNREVFALLGHENDSMYSSKMRRCLPAGAPPGSGYSAAEWCRAPIDKLHQLHAEYVDAYDELLDEDNGLAGYNYDDHPNPSEEDLPECFLGFFVVGTTCARHVEATFAVQSMPVAAAHYAEQALREYVSKHDKSPGPDTFLTAGADMAVEWLDELETCTDVIRTGSTTRPLPQIAEDRSIWEPMMAILRAVAKKAEYDDAYDPVVARVQEAGPVSLEEAARLGWPAAQQQIWTSMLALGGARARARLRQHGDAAGGEARGADEEDDPEDDEVSEEPAGKRRRSSARVAAARPRPEKRRGRAATNAARSRALLDQYGVTGHPVDDRDEEPSAGETHATEARCSSEPPRAQINGAGPSDLGAADDGDLDAELDALGDAAFAAMGKLVRRKASHGVIAQALDCFERLQRLRRSAAADA